MVSMLNPDNVPTEYAVRCKNFDSSIECDNYADTRTGGDMNPYGNVSHLCGACTDAAVSAYYP